MTSPAPILSFTIDCPRTLNHAPRHWGAKARLRSSLYMAVLVAKQKDPHWRAAVLHPTLPEDQKKRRVVFTRGVGIADNAPTAKRRGKHPVHVADVDGLAGGLKPCLDVLLLDKPRRHGHGFLVDDSPSFCVVEYRQDGTVDAGKLRVDLYECEVTP